LSLKIKKLIIFQAHFGQVYSYKKKCVYIPLLVFFALPRGLIQRGGGGAYSRGANSRIYSIRIRVLFALLIFHPLFVFRAEFSHEFSISHPKILHKA